MLRSTLVTVLCCAASICSASDSCGKFSGTAIETIQAPRQQYQPQRCVPTIFGGWRCPPQRYYPQQPQSQQMQVEKQGSAFCVGYNGGRTILVTAYHCIPSGDRSTRRLSVDGVPVSFRAYDGDVAILEAEGTSTPWQAYPVARRVPPSESRTTWEGYGGGRWGSYNGRIVASRFTNPDTLAVTPAAVDGDSGGPVAHRGEIVGMIVATDDRVSICESCSHIRRLLTATYGQMPTLSRTGRVRQDPEFREPGRDGNRGGGLMTFPDDDDGPSDRWKREKVPDRTDEVFARLDALEANQEKFVSAIEKQSGAIAAAKKQADINADWITSTASRFDAIDERFKSQDERLTEQGSRIDEILALAERNQSETNNRISKLESRISERSSSLDERLDRLEQMVASQKPKPVPPLTVRYLDQDGKLVDEVEVEIGKQALTIQLPSK